MASQPPPAPAPRPSGWKRYWKRFFIAFLFAAIIDLSTDVLHLSLPYLGRINARIEYTLESVNLFRLAGDLRDRLADRHHYRVWSWSAPFNLSRVCAEGRGAEYGDTVAPLCVTTARPTLAPGARPELEGLIKTLPFRQVNTVNEDQYPRNRLIEVPLGLPDATLYAIGCSWNGVDTCPPGRLAAPRSNWLGRAMLLLIVVVALYAAAPARNSSWSAPRFIAACAIGLVVWVVGAFVLLMVFEFTTWVSRGVLELSNTVVALAAIRPLAWSIQAVKDVAADRAKSTIGGESAHP